MKIIQEDAETLIFEDHPNAKPDKEELLFTSILVLFILLGGLFLKVINISHLLFAAIISPFFILGYFIYGKLYAVKVKVDKKTNVVSISNLTTSWSFWENKQAEIPMHLISKIEYHSWTPLVFNVPNPNLMWGRLVFILNNSSEVNFYTWGHLVFYKNYGRIGKKIADYINVPFEMH